MTIYALSSGAGISGVAVIRISGEKTKEIIRQITGRELPKPRIASLNKIREIKTKELIDEGIIIWFQGQIVIQVKIWPSYMYMEVVQ